MMKWFTDYLSERKQRVINEVFKSTRESTLVGVPQGSVLGPFLFLQYINDIVKDIKTNIRLFADDTSLFVVLKMKNPFNCLMNILLLLQNVQMTSWYHYNQPNKYFLSIKKKRTFQKH